MVAQCAPAAGGDGGSCLPQSHHTTPRVMVHLEFDSLTSWQAYLASESYAGLMFDLRAVGCTRLAVQVWDASPLVPELVTPSSD